MAFEDLGLFGQPLFTNIILPFLLVFTVIFAILEKTSILGKDKRQINAIVAFVFGLVSIGVPAVTGVLTKVIPVITVMIVILLSWMLVLGFIGGTTPEGGLPPVLRLTLGIILAIAFIITILWATGALDFLRTQPWSDTVFTTIIIIVFIIAVISIVVSAGGKEK
jgi:hypothetical protein